ncbi:MAG: hypothetical protein H0T50_08005 [Gemmatimonadales bacterium]|nr:hypothetical protein [Gemmatimonadales bacterium]
MKWLGFAALAVLCLALRIPRLEGPVDLRFDAGIYYTLGTSLAQGKGYRILSEPGEIHEIQYPPLLPAVAAAHQLVLGTADPDIIGPALRWSYFLLFTAYVLAVFWTASAYLATGLAFLVALIVALHFRTNFNADYFIAELPFGLVAVLFVGIVGRNDTAGSPAGRHPPGYRAVASGLLALLGFYLRTVGIVLLGLWVAESLFRRQYRQAALRMAVALLGVGAWQGYVAAVQGGPEYVEPAYPYQRAAYMMYNVTYGENFWLIEPLRPEAGRASARNLLARVGSNLSELAIAWGESISIDRNWWVGEAAKLNRMLGRELFPRWTGAAALISLTTLILGGLVLLGSRRRWLIPSYLAMSIALIVIAPYPGSLKRYAASFAPFSAIALLALVSWVWHRLARVAGWRRPIGRLAVTAVVAVILAQEIHTLRKSFRMLYYPATWVDSDGRRRTYPLLAYNRQWRLHDEALAWLRHHATPGEIIATSTPHWAYLKTQLKTVQPPWEHDPRTAQRLLDAVPADYLIIDNLLAYELGEVARRYSIPVVQAFPERWKLIYAVADSGSRIYRRVAVPQE